jgi:hypothetical protein
VSTAILPIRWLVACILLSSMIPILFADVFLVLIIRTILTKRLPPVNQLERVTRERNGKPRHYRDRYVSGEVYTK